VVSGARATTQSRLDGATALKARFDAAAGGPQLLALVSPTCEVCLDGVSTVLSGLDEPAGDAFMAHIVWLPVLGSDTGDVAAAVARDRRGSRVEHYWDDTASLSRAAHTALGLAAWDRTVAWDVYLLYPSGVSWSNPLPSPKMWLHQLRIEDQPSLDADSLRSAMQALTR